MENQTSIKQMLQWMMPDGVGVVEGTVTKALPLEITLTNDAKMVLSINSLVIPKHLTDYEVNANIMGKGQGKIIIYSGLKTGEKVYLFFYNNGKKYYVLDRKG